jgi:hypothetical protein
MNKKKISKIIKLTSRNTGLSYIGVTCQSIQNWLANIVFEARDRVRPNSKLQRAIRKEGIESFTKEILDSDLDHRFARDQLLPMYISVEDTYITGLNTLKGGLGIPGFKAPKSFCDVVSRRAKARAALGILPSNKGTHWITNGWTNRMATAKELVEGLPKGWKLGMTQRSKLFKKKGRK